MKFSIKSILHFYELFFSYTRYHLNINNSHPFLHLSIPAKAGIFYRGIPAFAGMSFMVFTLP